MRLNFRRILAAESMRFRLRTQLTPENDELPDDFDPQSEKNLNRIREEVIGEIAELLDAAGVVANRNRLEKDLLNREKKAVTAVGSGLAIPHVRTIQAKRFAMAFARSSDGLPFRAPDGEPVHVFVAMVSPPFEDRLYLKIYRTLGQAMLDEELRATLFAAVTPNDVWEVLERFQ